MVTAAAAMAQGGDPGAGTNGTIPNTVEINAQALCPTLDGLPKDKRAVKGFTHRAHIAFIQAEGAEGGAVCLKCHQADPREKGFDPCEDLNKRLAAKGGPKKLASLFHSTCKSCHKRLKKEGKAAGPVACKGCHARK